MLMLERPLSHYWTSPLTIFCFCCALIFLTKHVFNNFDEWCVWISQQRHTLNLQLFCIHIFHHAGEIEESSSLFLYSPSKGHDSYQSDTFQPLMNVPLVVLYPACEEVTECVFDYTVSGRDPELADATLGAYKDFQYSIISLQKK